VSCWEGGEASDEVGRPLRRVQGAAGELGHATAMEERELMHEPHVGISTDTWQAMKGARWALIWACSGLN
jgi:hypothetical protein